MRAKKEVTQRKRLQVVLLPWLKMEKKLTVGKVVFWPYSLFKKRGRVNQEVFTFLDRYVACYRDADDNLLREMTLCTLDRPYLRPIDEEKLNEIDEAVRALSFASISNNAASRIYNFSLAQSDAFQWFVQNFDPREDTVVVPEPGFTGIYKLGEVGFRAPFRGRQVQPRLDQDGLVSGLGAMLIQRPKAVTDRVLRSTEWFRMGFSTTTRLSDEAKVVMLATALEGLLLADKRVSGKQEAIALRLEEDIAKASTFSFKTKKDKLCNKKRTLSLLAWWGSEFYKLRNAIVHGDTRAHSLVNYTTAGGDEVSHLWTAAVVMRDLVIRSLFEQQLFGNEIRAAAKRLASRARESEREEIFRNHLYWRLEQAFGLRNPYEELEWLQQRKPPLVSAGGKP